MSSAPNDTRIPKDAAKRVQAFQNRGIREANMILLEVYLQNPADATFATKEVSTALPMDSVDLNRDA